jgi:hypothetical protein
MPDLEELIVAWRRKMAGQLPEMAVRELEEHLRDHVDAQVERGMTASEAFDEALRLIGTPEALAPEFRRLAASRGWTVWRQAVVVSYLAAAAALVVFLGLREALPTPMTPLLAAHVFAVTAGYLAFLAAAVLGAGGLAVACLGVLHDMERSDLRRWSIRLTLAGGTFLVVGTLLGMVWASDNLGRAWNWDPAETGVAAIMIATGLLLMAQRWRSLPDLARGALVVLGGSALLIAWFGGNAKTGAIPIAWMSLANIVAQATALLMQPVAGRIRVVAK